MTTPARLQPVQQRGWRRGLGNLLGKEFGAWWRTRMGWLQALIWLVVINGMVALVAVATQLDPEAADQLSAAGLSVFFIFGGLAAAVGAIITTQGAIIGERQLGTAAWILSKPAARSAFILAKLIAHGVGLLGLTLVLQAPIAVAQLAVWTGQTPPLLPFLAGVGVLALHLLFYLTLTLMLGVLVRGRGTVAGISFGMLLGGGVIGGLLPALTLAFPWKLPEVGMALALGQPLPPASLLPIIATAAWTVLFVAVALWRFAREEF